MIRTSVAVIMLLAGSAFAQDAPRVPTAVPVEANEDHESMLASDDPQLAANKRLVYDFQRAVEANDNEAVAPLLATEYVDHGHAFAILFGLTDMEDRVAAPLVAIVAERDLVAVVSAVKRETPRPYTTTAFDLYRIADGKIAEHWDEREGQPEINPRYRRPTVNDDPAASLASADDQLARNKRFVYDMWRTLLDAQQVEEAPKYLAPGYIQHNPLADTGLDGFLNFFRRFAQPKPVKEEVANFVEILAEGDLVVLATLRPGETPTTWFDMWRVDDAGLLAEHWDVATLP